MGIQVTNGNAKAKSTLKLISHIASYLFEEECGELSRYGLSSDKTKLQDTLKALNKLVERSKS